LSLSNQTFILFFYGLAYAIKIPIFPFHSWQPQTYTTAPTAGTMLLSAIMLKMGIYSIIRWILPVVPNAVDEYNYWIISFLCIALALSRGLNALNLSWNFSEIHKIHCNAFMWLEQMEKVQPVHF
jgi:NADH:ubiquinone oxidoreductase subunit 4 (subunit M)